jgi:hypothetical protein
MPSPKAYAGVTTSVVVTRTASLNGNAIAAPDYETLAVDYVDVGGCFIRLKKGDARVHNLPVAHDPLKFGSAPRE